MFHAHFNTAQSETLGFGKMNKKLEMRVKMSCAEIFQLCA